MWSAEEIFEAFANAPQVGRGRVHWQNRVPFGGHSGHYYFLRGRTRPVTSVEMARITRHSSNAEAALLLINTTYVVFIGNTGVASGTFMMPGRQAGLEVFEWLSHTHPREMESQYERALGGPSDADRVALEALHRRWGQRDSLVIVCENGEVLDEVRFEVEPPPAHEPGRPVWTPSFD